MVKLSVLVTFCNQRQYIKRALDSILAQKTNFDFEVLIGLDGVYDGSEEIIREYTDKHDFIRLYKMSFAGMDTIGIEKASLNRKSLLEKAEGEFFSVLDGDDFYGDDRKFQKQMDVLSEHPECIGCGCGHVFYTNERVMKEARICEETEFFTPERYIRSGRYIHNGSIIFRNIFYFGFPHDFPHNFVNDTTLTMYMMKFGRLACLPETMYMYQMSEDGIYQGESLPVKDLYGALGGEMNLRYLPEYREALLKKYDALFYRVYRNRKKYDGRQLAAVRNFAACNGCRFVQAILEYTGGGYIGRGFARLKCRYMLKHKNFGKKVKKRKIACWTGFPNFGDMFNLYVARYVFRWCVVPGWKEADLWCVGSLLSRLFEVRHENGKTLDVMGTGMQREVRMPEDFAARVRVHALRGKLSLEKLKELIPVKKSVVLADPAVLLRKMVDKSRVLPGGRVGVIPHYYDRNSECLNNIKASGIKIIRVEDTPIQVARDMLSCKCILSSSLHGLIFADALGIPNRRIVLSDEIIGGDLKFDDYYSVYYENPEEAPETIDLRKTTVTDETIDDIIKNYVNVERKMDEQCRALLKIKIN